MPSLKNHQLRLLLYMDGEVSRWLWTRTEPGLSGLPGVCFQLGYIWYMRRSDGSSFKVAGLLVAMFADLNLQSLTL